MTAHEERDERLTHRIESFSDLVIGFSLALLGLTLVIPQHAAELLRQPWWLITYFWTFGVIVVMWLNHQRLFSLYFHRTPVTIALNFLFLSMLGLIVYFVQVVAHAQDGRDRIVALALYFAAFALALVFIGALYAVGTRTRWHLLAPRERFVGITNAVRSLIIGGTMLIGIVAIMAIFPEAGMSSISALAIAVALATAGTRLYLRLLKPKILSAENA